MKGIPIILIAVATLSSCAGGASPQIPAQVPTSIEYAGYISVQTGKSLHFTARDAGGNIAQPSSVDCGTYDLNGVLVEDGSLGSITTEGNDIVYTAPNSFPNVSSRASIKCEYAGTEIGSFTSRISVSKEAITSALYTFGDRVLISADDAEYPAITTTDDGTVFACFRRGHYGDQLVCRGEICGYELLLRDLVVVKSADAGGTWSEPSIVQVQIWDDPSSTWAIGTRCSIAAYDSNTVAVAWPATQMTTEEVCTERGCSDEVTETTDYYLVAFSSDGGITFTEPMIANTVPTLATVSSPEQINIRYDANGVLHVVYVTTAVGPEPGYPSKDNIYHTYYSTSGRGDTTRFNSTEDSVYGDATAPAIAVYGTDAVKIFAVWEDTRDLPVASNLYMGEISYSSGDVELIRNVRIDSTSNTDMAYGQSAIIDRDGSPVITWSGANLTNFTSDIYLAKWFEDEGSVGTNIIASDLTIDFLSAYSNVVADYANNLHLIYSFVPIDHDTLELDWGASGVKYTMGSYVDNASGDDSFDATPSIDVLAGITATDTINAVNDLAGRTYVILSKQGDSGYWETYVYIGTIR